MEVALELALDGKGVRMPRKIRILETVGNKSRAKIHGKLCGGHSFDRYISVQRTNSDSVCTPAVKKTQSTLPIFATVIIASTTRRYSKGAETGFYSSFVETLRYVRI